MEVKPMKRRKRDRGLGVGGGVMLEAGIIGGVSTLC